MADQPSISHRFNVHKVDDHATLNWMALMRRTYAAAAVEIDKALETSREKSLALTKLEEAMFWTSAAAARSNGEPNGYGEIGISGEEPEEADA